MSSNMQISVKYLGNIGSFKLEISLPNREHQYKIKNPPKGAFNFVAGHLSESWNTIAAWLGEIVQ